MSRVYNFSAGPAVLPEEVLKKAAHELVEYNNCGMSVMEMSHRTPVFQEIIDKAESCLRKIMAIPDNYKILFLQGGASLQFAMIPMNLMIKNKKADFVHTGQWTKKAIQEAKRFGAVNIIATSEDKNYSYIPDIDRNNFDPDADYFHICTNNTIYGTRYTKLPDTGKVPLVMDMSSNIISEKTDVSKCGIIFAGAQKNIGPAGLTIVIIREDLTDLAPDNVPAMLRYSTHADNGSMFNTPPTYAIYMAKLIFENIIAKGGIEIMEKTNLEKAGILYDFLDESAIFSATIKGENRSIMNVTFSTGSKDQDARFIKEAEQNRLVNLKGHRLAGGMRASIYNAMSVEGVNELVKFMKKFELENK